MGVLLLVLVAVVSGYPYSSYNGYYNRFGDYMMPGRTDYYSTSSGAFYPTYGYSSYAPPPVATVNHGFGDYYRGYGNSPSAYGATDGRFGYLSRPGFSGSYPLLANDFPSPLDRSFNLRFPFKKQ